MKLAPTSQYVKIAALCAAVVLASFAAQNAGAGDDWQTDFKAAKAKAKEDKKYMLVDFTGSDWCGWCIKLHDEVFSKEPFATEGPKRFVLVELDFPHEKKQSDAIKKQNEELSKKYKIEGFPSVLMMDSEGQVIARTGYREGGPESYLKFLAECSQAFDTIVAMKAKLNKSEGLVRAKLLDGILEAYTKLENEPDEASAWAKEIVKLDPDNKAGLRIKYEFRDLLAEAGKLKEEQKFEKARELFDKALALTGVDGELRQDAFLAEGECFFYKHDFVGLVSCLTKGLESAPKSEKAKQIEGMIVRFGKMAKAQESTAKLEAGLVGTKGIARAKLLDQLVDAKLQISRAAPDDTIGETIKKLSDEIIEIDADNKAGLKRKYQFKVPVNEAVNLMHTGQAEDAIGLLDKALETPGISGDEIQEAQFQKANCQLIQQHRAEAKECLMKALEASPKGPFADSAKTLIRRLEGAKKPAE